MFEVDGVDVKVGATTGKLKLKPPVGTARPIDTVVRLSSFNLHAVHERTGREATQPVALSEAFIKRQTITLSTV